MATKATTKKATTAAKATEAKVEAKVAEVKVAAKETAKEVKETAKTTAKKAAATTKTVAKKTVAKAAAKANTVKSVVTIQYQNKEVDLAKVEDAIKAQYIEEGHTASSIKKVEIYVKPEDCAAYYVINGQASGRVDLF